MLVSKFRTPVDTHFPSLGRFYRGLRDITWNSRKLPTRFGFTLAGCASMADGAWEAHEIDVFLESIASHDAVLDIGANIGFYTCLAASQGKQTLAFEPCSRNVGFLYRNLWENGLLDVEILPVALGDRTGLTRIFGRGDVASLVPGWANWRESQAEIVPMNVLDSFVVGRLEQKRLLIKVDVEGFELEVLNGAKAILDLDRKPTWMIEILLRGNSMEGAASSRLHDTFAVFWEHGYACRKIDGGGTPVTENDVNAWIREGCVDGNTSNFIFSAV